MTVVVSSSLLAENARWLAFAVLCLMALLAASMAELRAVGTPAASGHMTRAPAAVAARGLLATTDSAVDPANPYLAEFQRPGGQVIRQRSDSRLLSRIRPPQRLDYLFVEVRRTQRSGQLFGNLRPGSTLVEVPYLDHGCVLYGASNGHIAENPVHLRAEGGGLFHAFSKLQHQGTRGAASDGLDATPD
uniref:Uncharacterized protein n=1 Tax=Trichogramma kaykai TaxID=54128 RepID=A0ABD2XLX5_9HYME